MTDFFVELKRRHIYRVGAAYVVAAWALTQVVEILAQVFTLPLWIAQAAIALLALGFPIALILAWVIESKPHEAVAAAVREKPTIVDWALCGALAFVTLLIGYQQLAPSADPTRLAGMDAAKGAAVSRADAVSLAVLPFANLSSDPEQEFFSDGITEEITSALARVPDLRVVGRTSAFQFKGQNQDLRTIGEKLSATHLLEGSVRKEGNAVRITAQLIRAVDGTHLWTESYNRELTGVFAIQEEIATAIARSLSVPLGLRAGQNLVASRTVDTESYEDYLRARALVRVRGPLEPGGPLTDATKLLERVVERDPNYAPAWGLLGQIYALSPNFTAGFANGSPDEFRNIASETQKAEAAAQQATRLDPGNVDGHVALAFARNWRGAFIEAEASYKQALLLDPGNTDALQQYSFMLASVGQLTEAMAMRLRLQALEPLVPIFNMGTAHILSVNGRDQEAVALLEALPATLFPRFFLAEAYASMGRYDEAARALQEIPPGFFTPGAVEEAARLLRSAPARIADPQSVISNGFLGFVYLYAGAPDRSLDFFDGLADAQVPGVGNAPRLLWSPAFKPTRGTERFKALIRKTGLIDYWRAKGWPDVCRPIGADDFTCT
jgi:TolB-like protein